MRARERGSEAGERAVWERGKEDGREGDGVRVHVGATWYMRVAATTSKPKGNTSALLITDTPEVQHIRAR